jgi:Ca2+-binding EF-hand superfamily protein
MNPIQPGSSIQEMARSLMRTVDTNGNGELSTEEFTSFLA